MNIALFDFDGTLTDCDCFTAFIRFATPKWRLWPATLMVTPMFLLYKVGMLKTTRLRALMVWLAFAGRREDKVKRQGEIFAREYIPTHLRPKMLERLLNHVDQDDAVAMVSASLSVYLKPFCLETGIECLSSELASHNGRLTGRYVGSDCTAEQKVARVRSRFDLDHYATVYAYGDTPEDDAMLALADVKFYQGREVVV